MSSSQTTTASATTTTSHSPLTDHNHTHTHMNHHNHTNSATNNNVGHHLTNDQNSSPTKNRLNNLKHSLATTGTAGCGSTCENGNDETFNPKRMRLSESIENINNNTSSATNHVTTNNCITSTNDNNSQVCFVYLLFFIDYNVKICYRMKFYIKLCFLFHFNINLNSFRLFLFLEYNYSLLKYNESKNLKD